MRSSASQPVSVEIPHSEPIKIPETVPIGSRIARVQATDRDIGDNSKIVYRIVSENSKSIGGMPSRHLTARQYLLTRNKSKHFTIDRSSGEVSVAKPLKPDTEYALNISATDRGGLRSYTGIRVLVQDVNNYAPRFQRPWYTFEILEGNYLRGEIGKVQAEDEDAGINGVIMYSLRKKELTDLNHPFRIDRKTGMIHVEGQVDREKKSRYLFKTVATDQGSPPMETEVDVEVNILDVSIFSRFTLH